MTGALPPPVWRKSSRCTTGACVEVAPVGDTVLVRDSKDPGAAPLAFSKADWQSFIEKIMTRAL